MYQTVVFFSCLGVRAWKGIYACLLYIEVLGVRSTRLFTWKGTLTKMFSDSLSTSIRDLKGNSLEVPVCFMLGLVGLSLPPSHHLASLLLCVPLSLSLSAFLLPLCSMHFTVQSKQELSVKVAITELRYEPIS